MALEVFRRNQRTLLAVLAILAMTSFVVSDSVPRLLSSSYNAGDQPVVKLRDGKTIYQSDIQEMANERALANQFVSRLVPFYGQSPFGGLKTRDMVDAIILKREADRLGLPSGPEMGKDYLKVITRDGRPMGPMTGAEFEARMSEFQNRVSGEQVLSAIAEQVRMMRVLHLAGESMVTPYDVFRAYREENEKVAAKLVEVPVSKFLGQVGEPSADDVRSYFDRYKDVLPDPTSPTPGFKIPRQIQVEILSKDGNALRRQIQDKLTEDELRAAYENRKNEFPMPHQGRDDLPDDLFADAPELTPPALRPFAEVRSILSASIAEKKAQEQIDALFDQLKRDDLDKFYDAYQDALDAREEAKKEGEKKLPELPEPASLESLAKREGLSYEISPMLSLEDAEKFSSISNAQVGISKISDGRKFAEEFFDSRTPMFESVTLSDFLGTRYLARKVKDVEPRVPTLDEVRPRVVLAWKTEHARPLAKKAAETIAAELKKQAKPPADSTFQGYPVISVPPIARKFSPISLNNAFQPTEPIETPIEKVADPGETFRTAYFGLKSGDVAVAPNHPETSYYAMILDRREPASFAALYAPAGDEYRFTFAAKRKAERESVEHWLSTLRDQAGVPAGWTPADEATEKKGQESQG